MEEETDDEFYSTPFRNKDKTGEFVNFKKQQLLQESSISIILDTYDDIFSDFDARGYGERALSDDFLPEIKRAAKDKPSGDLQLSLLMPKDLRNLSVENTIKHRLKEHFKRHAHIDHKGLVKTRNLGILMILIGAILGVLATALYDFGNKSFLSKFILILMEPASWFNIWEGMNHVFFESKDLKQEFVFNDKMAGAEIKFLSY